MNLSGQIAVLKQEGKQVAGLYDWESRLILKYTTKDGMRDYKPTKRIDAQSYWLVEPVKDNAFYAEFYEVKNNALVMVDAGNVAIDFPDCHTLDRRLYAPIQVRWVSAEY